MKFSFFLLSLISGLLLFCPTLSIKAEFIHNQKHYKLLGPIKHEYQKPNQCGPVTAGMVLNYWLGLKKNQFEIGAYLRPHPDDKHTLLEQFINYLAKFGLKSKIVYSPDYELIKKFIAHGIPIVVYQKSHLTGKIIGHYRLVRGYNEAQKIFIAADSYYGPKYQINYENFNELWRPFGYLLIIPYPANKEKIVNNILGPMADRGKMISEFEKSIQNRIKPADPYDFLNAALIAFLREDYAKAVENFEKAQQLGLDTERILWYIEWPITAYNKLKNSEKVFELTDLVFQSGNSAAAELVYERGRAFLNLGEHPKALAEFLEAISLEPYFKPPIQALSEIKLKN